MSDGYLDPYWPELVAAVNDWLASEVPGLSVRIVSGYRSPQYQAELRARWDRGDRAGLVARPALSSMHSTGIAADLGWAFNGVPFAAGEVPLEAWRWLADVLGQVGVIWGGARDVVHFELAQA